MADPVRVAAMAVALLLLSGAFTMCLTRPRRQPPAPALDTAAPADAPVAQPVAAARPAPPPNILAIDHWPGHRFIALPISPVYRQFGYELYPTAALGTETGPLDPKLQLKNRRYRYETLVGKVLRVEDVERRDTAWLVPMVEESSGRRVYGVTHKDAIKGIALLDDLEEARTRWTGKTVYARNRQINTLDSASGKMGSVKVAIETPLTVTGVRWGILPLPPQPLWLMVRTPDSVQGFVPVHVSWTNVMSDVRRTDLEPWAEFVYRQNPRTRYKWDEEVWAQINAHHLTTGMTFDQAWVCWGEPLSRDSVVDDGVPHARWTYKGEHVLFRDGVVVKTVGR